MTNVLIILQRSRDYSEPYYRALREAFPEVTVDLVDHVDKAGAYLDNADVLITFGPHITDAAAARARRLKWVQSLGTGVDAVINRPFPESTIITTIRGIHTTPVSESILLAMLALSRDFMIALHAQDERRWYRDAPPARLIEGSVTGIFGTGLIALGLATRLKALGSTIVGISATPRPLPNFDRMCHRDELLFVLPDLDFLVMLTPYVPATHHIIDAQVLAAMKPTACLINMARGGLVDEAALADALNRGKIGGAALDVFEIEPPPADHPLWSARNVLITPHIAASAIGNHEKSIDLICENLRHFLAGNYAGMVNVVTRQRGT
jgi:D-2-hydroxyacid dehydrogenase (NADP+)